MRMTGYYMGGYRAPGADEYHTDEDCPRGRKIPPTERVNDRGEGLRWCDYCRGKAKGERSGPYYNDP